MYMAISCMYLIGPRNIFFVIITQNDSVGEHVLYTA